MTPPLVSIILVNRNCGGLVDLVFPTIVRQTYAGLEIVVVDNGSDDDSVARIQSEYPTARVIELGGNTGFSHALNVGIRETAGEFVLSLNFDVVLEPDFVTALVDAVRDRPEVGWAAGALRKLTPDRVVTQGIDCFGHYLLRSRYCYGYDPDQPDPSSYQQSREVFGASGCGALYRRSMLESLAVGGEIFDEDLFAYFEDVDLDWRAQHRGYKCLFVPAARGAHMRGGTGLSRRPEVAALLLSNRFLVMLKNDEAGDVLADAAPIVLRTLRDIAAHLRAHPASIPMAAARLLRLAPRMVRKRRDLKSVRRSGPSAVRTFRLATRSLG